MTLKMHALVTDRRARIPFAIIAILLLLLSGVFVVQTETSRDSTPKFQTDRAMEQTEAATQTALSDALAAASEQAATQPLTAVSDTRYGQALSGTTLSGRPPFDRYLAALVYLAARDRLDTAGQDVGAVETEVLLPEITSGAEFETAIDSVTIRPGVETPGIETGVVEAEIANVTLIARAGGQEIARRTKTVTVSVATPLYQLHDRTEQFQERLDAGVTESGFAQRFNARIYALGWARGYAQYSGLPVTEVIANRHIVPSANDAIYRTQKDVFGAPDPQLNNAIRRGWTCMALQDAEGLYEGHTEKQSSLANGLCEQSKWLFGDQRTGELPDAPGAMDLLGNAPGMDAEHTIGVNRTAYLPLQEMLAGTGEHSFDSVIDRIYEVETALDLSTAVVSEPDFSHEVPPAYRGGYSSVEGTGNERTTVDIERLTVPDEGDQYAAIEGEARLRLNETKEHVYRENGTRHETTTTAYGTREIDFEIALNADKLTPNAKIDDYSAGGGNKLEIADEHTYQQGPERSEASTDRTVPDGSDSNGFPNYGTVTDAVLSAFFTSPDEDTENRSGEAIEPKDIEEYLESAWDSAEYPVHLELPASKTVDISVSDRESLAQTLVADIQAIQEQASGITHRFERSEVLHDGSETGPYGELIETVEQEKQRYLDREEPYVNVGQKVVYEARYAYFEALEAHLGRLESAHGHAMDELDGELSDTGLDQALTYLQEGVTATPPDPVPLDSPSMTDNISYEVSGSPTYLVTENVTAADVPPVDNDIEAFAPMAARNKNYFKLPYESVVDGLLSRFASLFGFGNPDAKLTFQMASEALRAGELATVAAGEGEEYGDVARLADFTATFEASVEEAVSEFAARAAEQIALELYSDDVVGVCLQDCPDSDGASAEISDPAEIDCDAHDCETDISVPEDCTDMVCFFAEETVGKEAYPEVKSAVTKAVESYDESTAATAAGIASGAINKSIVDAVFEALNDSAYRPEYAESVAPAEWRSVIDSATRPATMRAASEGTVTISDTDVVEALDVEVRQALENVTADMVKERFSDRLDGESFDLEEYGDWVGGTDTPVRVPAGMPLLPLPNLWFATVNAWDIDVEAEYARFEVSANVGTPETADSMSYVREDEPVKVEIAGETRLLGSVEPITVSGGSTLVVVVPPGGLGVGDRDDEDPECSPTWPVAGDVAAGTIQCGESTADLGKRRSAWR